MTYGNRQKRLVLPAAKILELLEAFVEARRSLDIGKALGTGKRRTDAVVGDSLGNKMARDLPVRKRQPADTCPRYPHLAARLANIDRLILLYPMRALPGAKGHVAAVGTTGPPAAAEIALARGRMDSDIETFQAIAVDHAEPAGQARGGRRG